ncbi:dTDP-4-amino-4,6-dideoxy-D-glucose ammonia-lyase [Streptomyces sp. NBRC 110028]|uniref:dTDP-4-amino-4,6-dideoxy-D-glucose ammonia-lyase n=1 Tax=Streptomyces sp. NBRC 110028 TaxID=1621260 RepID=UPI000AEE7A6E|nr:dTDP-4-amino-4,6-dideoxy-D-glucose ammonia-lyase [Streptomyces sp. NBRC 110028]
MALQVDRTPLDPIAVCAWPAGDSAAAAALRPLLDEDAPGTGLEPDRLAEHLIALARRYGTEPFTPLESARRGLGLDRATFSRVLAAFHRTPALRTAVEQGPAGMYWTNTILPLERRGVLDAAVRGEPAFPYSVGLYPGPSCMFRCHFCVRVTGARYQQSALTDGNAMFASLIDRMPTDNPHALYLSGGLEPLTNPGTGDLVRRAAARGFKLSLYTNSFALTRQTLDRQPGLWDLYALRTSLYGLSEDDYVATTTKKGAFQRVKDNLTRFQALRREREAPVRLGLNYIILPGRAGRLIGLADYIADLNDAAPDRPVDFLTLREDYSGRLDGKLAPEERGELEHGLAAFEERIRTRAPSLHVDYGYALQSLRLGVDAELPRIRPETMRPTAHPQVAVQVDLLGDVYLYREAGFPGLQGAERYVAGRLTTGTGLEEVVRRFVTEGRQVAPRPGEEYFLDGFDQTVTARLNQLETDIADGWAEQRGFLR